MIDHIKCWFAPPVFGGDQAKTRRANLLNVALINILTLMPVLMFGNLLGGRTPLLVFGANAAAIVLCLLLRGWMRRGRVQLASVGLMTLGFILITASAASVGTIRAPTTAMYLLLVVTAGLLFDLRGMIVTTALCSLVIGGLIMAANTGWLPRPDYTVTITQWVAYTAICGWTGSLTMAALRVMRQALGRADQDITERKRAEEALRVSEERYRTLVEQASDGIFIADANGNCVDANPSGCRMLGYSRKQILKLNMHDLVPPQDQRVTPLRLNEISSFALLTTGFLV